VKELLDACRYYVDTTGRRLTFEWALINGINDTPEQAKKLSQKLKGMLCHVMPSPSIQQLAFQGRQPLMKG